MEASAPQLSKNQNLRLCRHTDHGIGIGDGRTNGRDGRPSAVNWPGNSAGFGLKKADHISHLCCLKSLTAQVANGGPVLVAFLARGGVSLGRSFLLVPLPPGLGTLYFHYSWLLPSSRVRLRAGCGRNETWFQVEMDPVVFAHREFQGSDCDGTLISSCICCAAPGDREPQCAASQTPDW